MNGTNGTHRVQPVGNSIRHVGVYDTKPTANGRHATTTTKQALNNHASEEVIAVQHNLKAYLSDFSPTVTLSPVHLQSLTSSQPLQHLWQHLLKHTKPAQQAQSIRDNLRLHDLQSQSADDTAVHKLQHERQTLQQRLAAARQENQTLKQQLRTAQQSTAHDRQRTISISPGVTSASASNPVPLLLSSYQQLVQRRTALLKQYQQHIHTTLAADQHHPDSSHIHLQQFQTIVQQLRADIAAVSQHTAQAATQRDRHAASTDITQLIRNLQHQSIERCIATETLLNAVSALEVKLSALSPLSPIQQAEVERQEVQVQTQYIQTYIDELSALKEQQQQAVAEYGAQQQAIDTAHQQYLQLESSIPPLLLQSKTLRTSIHTEQRQLQSFTHSTLKPLLHQLGCADGADRPTGMVNRMLRTVQQEYDLLQPLSDIKHKSLTDAAQQSQRLHAAMQLPTSTPSSDHSLLMAVNMLLQQTAACQQHKLTTTDTGTHSTKQTQALVQQLQQLDASLQQTLHPQLHAAQQRMRHLTDEHLALLHNAIEARYSQPAQTCSIVSAEVDAIKQYRCVVHETHTLLAGQHKQCH